MPDSLAGRAAGTVRAVVLADTHVSSQPPHPRGSVRDLPSSLWHRLSECDLIFHAGDILDEPLLERLRQLAPVHAVRGNNDRTLGQSLEEVLEAEVAGVSVAMVHDSGPKAARPARLRRMFPAAQLVIFGHSHVPVNELGENGQILFNPGSPTLRRSQPVCSYGEIVFGQGGVLSRDVIPLP